MKSLKKIKESIASWVLHIREVINPSAITDPKRIPIIINNYNRLSTLKSLIASLEKRGYRNIYILDNLSTYPPLLEWYKTCGYEVIYLPKNIGFKALWMYKPAKRRFCSDYYIYTDSDVCLSDDCPDDAIVHLLSLMKKYKYARKIGLHLRIDNLPEHYANKAKVIEWEKKQQKAPNADGLECRPTDTTFAIYRPHAGLSRSRAVEAYRTQRPYSIDHLPWYMDSTNLSEEEKYYISHCSRVTLWTSKAK